MNIYTFLYLLTFRYIVGVDSVQDSTGATKYLIFKNIKRNNFKNWAHVFHKDYKARVVNENTTLARDYCNYLVQSSTNSNINTIYQEYPAHDILLSPTVKQDFLEIVNDILPRYEELSNNYYMLFCIVIL